MFNSDYQRSDRPRMGLGAGIAIAVASLAFFGVALPSMFVFGSGSRFGSTHEYTGAPPVASRLADRITKAGLADRITDEQLNTIMQSLVDKAARGDLEAASFVFELAARQRGPQPQPESCEGEKTAKKTVLRREKAD